MDVTITYFLSRLPTDFLLSSLLILAVTGMSSLFLLIYEILNPVRKIHLVLSLVLSRMFVLFSSIFLYNKFLSIQQFQNPIVDPKIVLMLASISILFLIQNNYYTVFFESKKTHFLHSNFWVLGFAVWAFFFTDNERFAFNAFMCLSTIALIYNYYLSCKVSKPKIKHPTTHFLFSLSILGMFYFKIGYVYGYTLSLEILKLLNENSVIFFVLEVMLYVAFFAYSDKSIVSVFSKMLDMNSSRNVTSISKEEIIRKKIAIW